MFKLEKNHHATKGSTTEITLSSVFNPGGISSASRQNTEAFALESVGDMPPSMDE